MLGYCMICDKLTPIRQGEQQWGSRQRNYYPHDHDKPDGTPCVEGPKKAIK